MDAPAISIILTTYDRPAALTRALHSIRRQTFTDWELIVIADGPPAPATRRVIERFARGDDRVRPVRFETNANNPAMRMNQAMTLARASLLAFQDDDDLWYPNALEDLFAAHHVEPDAALVYGRVNFMDARTGVCFHPRFGEAFDPERLKKRNLFCNNAVLVARDAVHAVGGYDESSILRAFFDWDLWLRISERFAVRRVDRVVGEVWAFRADSVGRNARIDYARIDARIRNARPLPLQGFFARPRKVVFLTHGHHPSLTIWRIDFLIEAMNENASPWRAARADVREPGWERALDDADVAVLYRFHEPVPEIRARQRAGLRVVVDLDDPVFDDAIPHHLHLADAVTVSTRALRHEIRRPNVFVRPNGIPRRVLEEVDRVRGASGDRFVVGWLAGLNPNDDEEAVLDIARGLAERRADITFYYLGKSAALHDALTAIPGLEVLRDDYIETGDLVAYYRRIKEVGVKAIIAPLADDRLNRAKSPIKLIDSAVLGAPLVASPVGAYADVIRPGKNGFLAATPEAFVDAIAALAANPSRADAVVAGARREARHRFDVRRVADRFVLDLNAVHHRHGVCRAMGWTNPAAVTPPALSVIIVNWNTEALLQACLQSLREHPFRGNLEVLVVDNGSRDDSADMVKQRFSEVRLVANPDNLGYAAATNQGLDRARGRFILLLNPDTEVLPGTLDRLVDFLEGHPGAGAVTARLLYPDGRPQPSCMRLPTPATALVHDTVAQSLPFGRRHHRRYLMRDFDHASSREVEQIPGTCLLMPRAVAEATGGMDPSLFLYFNDVDLCKRIRELGRSIHFLADAEILHHESAAVVNYSDQATAWHMDRARYYRKHFGWKGVLASRIGSTYAALRELIRTAWRRSGPPGTRAERSRHVLEAWQRVLRA